MYLLVPNNKKYTFFLLQHFVSFFMNQGMDDMFINVVIPDETSIKYKEQPISLTVDHVIQRLEELYQQLVSPVLKDCKIDSLDQKKTDSKDCKSNQQDCKTDLLDFGNQELNTRVSLICCDSLPRSVFSKKRLLVDNSRFRNWKTSYKESVIFRDLEIKILLIRKIAKLISKIVKLM